MRGFQRVFVFSIVLFALSDCSKSSKQPMAKDRLGLKRGEFAKDQAQFKVATPRPYRVSEYNIKASFDWDKKIASFEELISFNVVNDLQSLTFDLKGPMVLSVKYIKDDDQTPVTFSSTKDETTINLPQTLPSGDSGMLLVNYEVDLNNPGDDPGGLYHGIFLYEPVAADPVKSKVLYTASEPSNASTWLLCDDNPQHRAVFKTTFIHNRKEKFLANGNLIMSKDLGDDKELTAYETLHPLPTYLMAFALGEFKCANSHAQSGLLTQYCMRDGLPGDVQKNLKAVTAQVDTLEKVLGPFPWEKYMTVLIPEFVAGGMENAGMTFNHEDLVDMDSFRGASVHAHELSHQWFGDFVTVSTWDDLWIKEGMATFFENEVAQPYGKKAAQNPIFYQQPDSFDIKDAIIDTSLADFDKYTSGPYQRAGWFISQLRTIVGADIFWTQLRKILAENQYSSIGSKEFISYFLPYMKLSEAQLMTALYAKGIGSFKIEQEDTNRKYKVSYDDPNGTTLLYPLVEVANFQSRSFSLFDLSTGAKDLDLSTGFLVPDPMGTHGPLDVFIPDASRKLWNEATALPANFTLNSSVDLLGQLHPRARIDLLRASPALDGEKLALFFAGSESRTESDLDMEAVCERKLLSDDAKAQLNGAAKVMLTDAQLVGYSLQDCYSSLDPTLWQSFDQSPSLEEGVIGRYSQLGADYDRAKNVWLPLLKSTASLSAKRYIVKLLDTEFSDENIAGLSPDQKTELQDLLAPSLVDYAHSSQEETLQRIVNSLKGGVVAN